LLTDLGRRDEAEAHLRQGVALGEKLVVEIPHPFFRQDLAVRQTRLGSWLADLGRWDEADAVDRKALAILDDLAGRSPDMLAYRIYQATSRVALGHLLRDDGHSEGALDWYAKAIAALEPILAKQNRYVPARDALRDAHWGRARALDRLGRYAEAAQDWERAANLDDRGQRAVHQLGRAISQAHVSGNHRQALSEADSLAKNADGHTLAGMARACALASTPLSGGKEPAAAAPVREEYAARAVMLLRQAASKGYRDTLYLQQGTDLAILRGRKDFQKLLEDTDVPTDKHGP
jgi:tetratricopeptide (TPR) repeat protein